MRLWSVHPRYFDRQALTACWREALLAQAVLAGQTRGYQRHPQLERFRNHPSPLGAIGCYLRGVADEADARRYAFDRSKIVEADATVAAIAVPTGQLRYEWGHLLVKLEGRSPAVAERWSGVREVDPDPHPLFTPIDGPIASWERPAG